MRRWLMLGLLLTTWIAAGCGRSTTGDGLWHLKLGGKARLVAEEGASEIQIENLAAAPGAPRRPGRKGQAQPRIETTTLAPGANARILAIDGDDARVQITDGPHSGAIFWIECRRLEPVSD